MITNEIKMSEIKYPKTFMTGGILLISLGFLFPVFSQLIWFDIIEKIREAINTGDSGHLILASASINFLYAIQSTFIFMGTMLVIFHSKLKDWLSRFDIFLVSLITIIFLHWTNSLIFELPWEPVSTILALLITLFLFGKLFGETNSFIQVFIVSIQVFFAFHWLNIMPIFSVYRFGQSDILYSVKISGVYLHSETVLNFSGAAFFLPFIISAFITATLFISYSRNIHMMRENYEKENEIRSMRTKALENRVYQEVKSLVHDLKTPLVTIRGLNSLLLTASGQDKLSEYSNRIENSVTRMSEMISSFLYESSHQRLKVTELISYIRAQLPLEDEKIKFEIYIEDNLPDIYVNKIRIARAVINILENAIIVPYRHPFKLIKLEVLAAERGINIVVQDNGIGIKESDLQLIWEVGYSTNNTSGLGLPFAKRIFMDNDGTIEVQSQENIGTTATIFLPSVEVLQISGN
ncbi:MAG TPA: HAMP domain-containing sensor histidine kinase [Clostridia bacterium]|nr:HAMP domain-containing sensor histidine kinase [Clostridia bacterium]